MAWHCLQSGIPSFPHKMITRYIPEKEICRKKKKEFYDTYTVGLNQIFHQVELLPRCGPTDRLNFHGPIGIWIVASWKFKWISNLILVFEKLKAPTQEISAGTSYYKMTKWFCRFLMLVTLCSCSDRNRCQLTVHHVASPN